MKKLVMMLALAIAVVSAKAACVDWTVSATADLDGSVVYLLATAPGDYADVGELAAAAVSSSTITSAGRGKYAAPKTVASGEAVTADATYYYAIVASDGKSFNYVEASGLAAKVYDPAAQEASKGSFDSITASQIVAGTSKSFGGGGDVPEPTSGLLLLVGGAMLALRRKQK